MVINYTLVSSFKLYTVYNIVLKILKTSYLDLIFLNLVQIIYLFMKWTDHYTVEN